ncbi:MAG: hypothetical protein GQ477_00250, partial [Nanohaloarchaea archaeon]|nr:hypothetical protein [Candidatus Nanohaloarchaea archaeon]
MAGVIGSDDAVPGAGMSSSTITPGNSFIGTMSIESIDPVIRNGLEGDIKDFGPVKVVPSLCPDIMTIISYILNTDIKTKAEVSIFCKNSRPDEGWYDNIIETLGAELNYSYVQRPIHDYMLSFMTVKGNKYLYSLDLDSSNILA